MSGRWRGWGAAAAVAVYARVVRLCPVRPEFSSEMALVFADELDERLGRGGVGGLVLRELRDLLLICLSSALRVHGVVTALLTAALAIVCFGAELAVAWAHGPTLISTVPAHVVVVMVLLPGVAAGLISCIASWLSARRTPQRFLAN